MAPRRFLPRAILATAAAGAIGYATERSARHHDAPFPSMRHSIADLIWKVGTLGILLEGFRHSDGRWPTLADLGWRGSDATTTQIRRRAPWAVAGTVAFYALSPLVSRVLGESLADPSSYRSQRRRVPLATAAVELLVRYPVTVFVEESFFRGWIQPRLDGGAPVTSGLLFAGYHLQQAETIPSLVPVGISLGLLRWWRGSVWTAALVHYLGNAAFFTTTYILTPQAPTFRTGTV